MIVEKDHVTTAADRLLGYVGDVAIDTRAEYFCGHRVTLDGNPTAILALSPMVYGTRQPLPRKGRAVVWDELKPVVKGLVKSEIVDAFDQRVSVGAEKYGTMLETHNGLDAHLDAIQEGIDLLMYLGQLWLERGKPDVIYLMIVDFCALLTRLFAYKGGENHDSN